MGMSRQTRALMRYLRCAALSCGRQHIPEPGPADSKPAMIMAMDAMTPGAVRLAMLVSCVQTHPAHARTRE